MYRLPKEHVLRLVHLNSTRKGETLCSVNFIGFQRVRVIRGLLIRDTPLKKVQNKKKNKVHNKYNKEIDKMDY